MTNSIKDFKSKYREKLYQKYFPKFIEEVKQVYSCSEEEASQAFRQGFETLKEGEDFTFSSISLNKYLHMLGEGNLILHLMKTKRNRDRVLQRIYLMYRNDFIVYATYILKVNEEVAKDTFQEVILAFIENIDKKKLISLSSSLKRYLFKIGENMIFSLKKKEIKRNAINERDIEYQYYKDKLGSLYNEEPIVSQREIASAIDQLPKISQKVLTLFYARGFTLDEIASEMNYKSNQNARNSKSRGLKNLRELLKKYISNKTKHIMLF